MEKLAADDDVDLLALAKNPKDVGLTELEAKLKARAEAHEAAGRRQAKASAEYWRHIGALAFLHNTQKALAAYQKAVALDPDEPDGWRYLGELQFRLGDRAAASSFNTLTLIGARIGNKRAESMGCLGQVWIYLRSGDLNDAKKMAAHALQLAESDAWTEGAARAYGNLGLIYWTRGNLAKAEEMQLKALKLNEHLGRKEGMANAYRNLAVLHDRQSNKTLTCAFLRKERDLWRAMGVTEKSADAEH